MSSTRPPQAGPPHAGPPHAGPPQAGPPQAGPPHAGPLARTALGLYPAAWRARYGDEVRALLDDSGADLRTVASLVWQAIPAWICPPRHLHDGPARIRASLGTVGVAWAVLAGLAAVFVQLTQAQPTLQHLALARHPVIQWSYWVFDGAVGVSVLAVAVGGLPLWLLMLRSARSASRRRDLACLLAPAVVPAACLAAGLVTVSLVRQPGRPPAAAGPPAVIDVANGNVGRWWFLALVVLGFAAGVVSAAGPALALRRLRPVGPAVRLAARAAGLAAAAMGMAGAASVVAAAGLFLWARPYHQAWLLGTYLPVVLTAAAVAIVSAARGIRATRIPAAA